MTAPASKPASKSTSTASSQETTFEADQLKSTIRTTVPLTLAQRHTTSRLDDMLLQDVRIYGRTLSPAEVDGLSRGTLAAWLAAKPADKRSDVEKNELFDWWLPTLDPAYQTLSKKLNDSATGRGGDQSARLHRLCHAGKAEAPVAYVLNRGEYDKRKEQVKPDDAGGAAADAGRRRRATGSASRGGWCGRRIR